MANKKQQIILFLTVIILSLGFIGGIVVLGRNNVGSEVAPSPSAAPILGITAGSPSDNIQPNSTPSAAPELTGATEIETTQSAIATQSAKKVQVTLTNGKKFTLALYEDLAPKTVANFLSNVRAKKYDGLLFFRVEKNQQGATMLVQTGDPTNTGQGGGVMQAEYNKKPFTAGSVGIARGQNRDRNSDSQFFITTADVSQLNEEYTNFGDVIAGLEAVQSIKQGQPILMVREVQ